LIQESEDVLEFEGRMRASSTAILNLEIRATELELQIEEITTVQAELKNGDPQQGMDDSTRAEIGLLIAGASEKDPLWEHILDEIPERDQPNLEYILWLDQVLAVAESDYESHQAVMEALISDHESLTEDYVREIREAEGLSASLFIKEEGSQPEIIKFYPDTQIALLGSIVGLLIYIIIWVMYSERLREND
jgi:hypothetical protein